MSDNQFEALTNDMLNKELLMNIISILAEDKTKDKPEKKIIKPNKEQKRKMATVWFTIDPIEQILAQYVKKQYSCSIFLKYILVKEFLLKNEEIENDFKMIELIKTYIHNTNLHTLQLGFNAQLICPYI
ncbi:MAG: hypothetical protein ATN31_07920 [Candidatus Epulonipiscioides saccharophilum]|nr:MAG: hypothetical protein ATN31_07920 [Epulopiscium sp. AS2M-Bin001]